LGKLDPCKEPGGNAHRLPIGIQTFRKIREGDYYYVDKTGFALRLIEEGTHYFLSRPRRFGKSLFLDTLGRALRRQRAAVPRARGPRAVGLGAALPGDPLSFAEGVLRSRAELDERIGELLRINQARLGVVVPTAAIVGRFSELIAAAHAAHGERVVVLVDEYDKPILDNLTDPDTAREMRDGLRNLYSVIKGADAHIRFAFLTGVSKFSKVSLFSGLNNLRDITVSREYTRPSAATPRRISIPSLPRSSRGSTASRSAPGTTATTGPARRSTTPSMCCCCSGAQFRAWWFETATPTFLIDVLTERQHLAAAARTAARRRRAAFGLRCRSHISHRGAAVSDRLSHHRRGGGACSAPSATACAIPTGRSTRASTPAC
jgi:hypothetical protein